MKANICLAVFLLAVFLGACNKPTVDTSSDESMKASIAAVRESLSTAKKAKFDDAIKQLAFDQLDFKSLFTLGATGVDSVTARMKSAINGKTGDQIIAEAAQLTVKREQNQKEQALVEIKELEEKERKAAADRKHLEKFQVIRSRFYTTKQEFFGEQPIIELTVRNGTPQAISRAFFKGTLASPNRNVPWHEDTFNYSIAGGLEPGEEAKWKLSPNMFSGWGKTNAPVDAVFTVTVERLTGADGKTLYSSDQFGEREKDRLAQLKQKYGR
jgi:PBP1b-binding outer membrane lipoprotein LpoB